MTEVVTFNQPMDTSFTTASSFELLGIYRNVSYAAASWSWDSTDTILTIKYDGLPDDTYSLTFFASGFREMPSAALLASNYVARLRASSSAPRLQETLKPVALTSSLIYTGTDLHVPCQPRPISIS